MEPTLVSIDPRWAAGLLLSMTRVGAFVVASPLLRPFPAVGRLAFTVAVGAALVIPVDAADSLSQLLGSALVNAALGLALGWLTGAIFHLFSVAGGIVDFGSGLSVSQVFDPSTGESAAVFGRWFPISAMALFVVSGGLSVLLGGLHRSVRAIPLDGSLAVDADLLDFAILQVSQLMLIGVEIALPLAATLLVAEVLLGMASRLVPQFNVFLLGLPAKIYIALSVMTVLILRFPSITANVIDFIDEALDDVLRGFIT